MQFQGTGNSWLQANNDAQSLNLSGLPEEDAIALQRLNRKQQLANVLMQKALQGRQGGMAGRFYVPPSWTQGVAQLAEAALGVGMNKSIDTERELMAKAIEERRQAQMDAYRKATSPSEVQPEMAVDSTLVPNTFDIEKLQPDAQRAATRDANTTAYANTAAPQEIASGALTENIGKVNAVVPDQQMGAPARAIPVGLPVTQPPDPIKAREATLNALMSADPRVAQAVRFMEQQKAADEERTANRAFLGEQKAEDRAVRREAVAQQAQTALAQIQGNMLMRQGMIDQSDKNSERHAELMRQQQADKIEADKWKAKLEAETRRQHDETLKTIAAGHDAAKQGAIGAKEEKALAQKEQGQKTIHSVVATLRDSYNQLREGGGITDTEKSAISNIPAGIASSGLGQGTGRILGTTNQSLRNTIQQQRPLIMQAIMQATGMTAKQMDSNVELQMYLKMATDPTLDYQTNMKALDKIEELFGGGGAPAAATPSVPSPAAPAGKSGWSIEIGK